MKKEVRHESLYIKLYLFWGKTPQKYVHGIKFVAQYEKNNQTIDHSSQTGERFPLNFLLRVPLLHVSQIDL